MTFYVQYNTTTGYINATVNNAPQAPGPLPDGVGQIAFDDAVETDNKMVDLTTLELVALVLPPETVEDQIAALQARIDALKAQSGGANG